MVQGEEETKREEGGKGGAGGAKVVATFLEPSVHKRKNIVVNTVHCRNEVDTVQYVISKYGYRETRVSSEGSILWYGLALRDNDVEMIKMKKALINRYPLMDHFAKKNIFCVIISRL